MYIQDVLSPHLRPQSARYYLPKNWGSRSIKYTKKKTCFLSYTQSSQAPQIPLILLLSATFIIKSWKALWLCCPQSGKLHWKYPAAQILQLLLSATVIVHTEVHGLSKRNKMGVLELLNSLYEIFQLFPFTSMFLGGERNLRDWL